MEKINFVSQIRYDSSTAYGIKDLQGNVWKANGGSKYSNVTDPFGDNNAININGINGNYANLMSLTKYAGQSFQNITVCFWAKYLSSNKDYGFVFSTGVSNSNLWGIQLSNKSRVSVQTNFNSGSSSPVDNPSIWHYYEISFEGNTCRIFVDGVLNAYTKTTRIVSVLTTGTGAYRTILGQWSEMSDRSNNGLNFALYDFCILDNVWHRKNYRVPTTFIDLKNKGLSISTEPINLLDKTKVKGFTIDGIQPANTNRKVAFKVDNKWNKLTTEGALSPLPTQEVTSDSVLEEGNTAEELTALTNVPALVGKLVYPAFALYADSEATVMPTIGMTVKAEIDTTVDVYTKTDYSQEFVLHNERDVLVKSISVDSNTKGNGKVTLKARYATFDETAITEEGAEQTEKWSDYVDILSVINVKCHKLQIRADYQVSITDGSDSATLNDVIITYTKDVVAKADGTTDLVTLTEKFTNDLTYVHAYIKHKELIDADLKAYVRLQKTLQKADFKLIGYGTGARKTYKVTDSGINQDSLMVYVNGKAVYDFDFNTETSEITLVADVDVPINATYEFGWELFNYMEMQKGVSQVNDSGAYTTEYSYTIPAHDGEYTVTAIKYELIRPEGKVTDEVIGVGTGKRQIIQLSHCARKETIQCNGKWSYDYDSKRLTVIAPEGDNIVISYDWIAESPVVYGVMAGWAD